MDPRLSPKVMFRNPPGVTGQGYGDRPFTYIHTYIHTYIQAFIPAFFAGGNSHHGRRVSFAASYRGGRPCPRRHLPINGRVPILDAMYVYMGGLGCLFAAESNGIVQSLLRVISRRLRVVEWTWSWTLEAAPLTRRTI